MYASFNRYSIYVNASVGTGQAAQVICYQDLDSVGRIDFFANQSPPASYFWNNPGGVFLVLAMPIERLAIVLEVLREEGPFRLELHGQVGAGSTSPGYGGRLGTVDGEPVGEGERTAIRRALVPAEGLEPSL